MLTLSTSIGCKKKVSMGGNWDEFDVPPLSPAMATTEYISKIAINAESAY
jgi:hypothetical protein